MPSKHHGQLSKELVRLRRIYLPTQFSLTGAYTRRELELVRAYYVFAHAAIEQYLEEHALQLAKRACDLFLNQGKKRKALVGLSVFWLPVKGCQPNFFPKQKRHQRLATSIHTILNHYEKGVVEKNHGIKEKNVLDLLHPLAVDPDELDGAWLAAMSSFGEKRGSAAHASGTTFVVQHNPDPQTALQEVRALMQPPGGEGIDALDRLMMSL